MGRDLALAFRAIDAAEAAHADNERALSEAFRAMQRAGEGQAFTARVRYLRCRIAVARSACAVANAYRSA